MFRNISTFTLALLLLGLTFIFPQTSQAFEQISHFDSQITIQQNSSISITEKIEYITSESKHGIYRYIPVRYNRDGLNYTASIHSIKISDDNNKPIPYDESRSDGNVVLKIGDGDVTFIGPKTYYISYTVDNAVQQIKPNNQPELYWDITGEGWQIDIASSSATVTSTYASIEKIACYTGAFGTNDGGCQTSLSQPSQASFWYPKLITYGSNMTVALKLDANGFIIFPTPAQRTIKQITDNWRLYPLLLPGLLMLAWWWQKGRDSVFLSWNVFNHDQKQPQQQAPLWNLRRPPMIYQPLTELTPGEAGTLHDEKVDNEDIIAEIIDLARQKFLSIEQKNSTVFFVKKTEYIFTQLKEASPKLPAHQKYLLTSLFKTGKTVTLSELKGSFYTHMEKTKQMIFSSLTTKKLFASNPENTRGIGFAVATILTFIISYWGVHLLTLSMWWAIPFYLFSTVTSFLVAFHLPTKSATGSNLAWQVRGLKESIKRGAWREKIKEKQLYFEEVLPFAIALGVVDKLSKDMDKLNIKHPQYLSDTHLASWSTHSFINSFSTQASTSLSYNPNSSSSSSGSGFSGGSSGGGGGGGGGGSW